MVFKQAQIVDKIVVFPNPFTDKTTLQIRPINDSDDLEAQISIIDLTGKLIRTFSRISYNTDPQWDVAEWDGTNQYGQNVAAGMYFFRGQIRSLITQEVQTISSKVVCVR